MLHVADAPQRWFFHGEWHPGVFRQAVSRGIRLTSDIQLGPINKSCIWRDPDLYAEQLLPRPVVFLIRWHLREPSFILKKIRQIANMLSNTDVPPEYDRLIRDMLRNLHRRQRHLPLRLIGTGGPRSVNMFPKPSRRMGRDPTYPKMFSPS